MPILGYKGRSQHNYSLRDPQGYPGEFKHIIRAQAYGNSANEKAKEVEVTVSGTGNKTVTINDESLTIPYDTTGANATEKNQNTAQAIASAINDSVVINNVSTSVSGAVVAITGLYSGEDFDLSVSGTNITASVTQASSVASDIEYGLLVAADGDNIKLPSSTGTAKTVEVDLTGVTAGAADIVIGDIAITTAFDTNIATTGNAIASEINRKADQIVFATYASDVVTITGKNTDDFYFNDAGSFGGNATATVTTLATRADRVAGVLGQTSIHDSDGNNTVFAVRRGEAGDVLENGDAIAQAETDFEAEDAVYVRFSGTGKQGAVSNVGGAGLVKLDRARAKGSHFTALDIKLVRLQLD